MWLKRILILSALAVGLLAVVACGGQSGSGEERLKGMEQEGKDVAKELEEVAGDAMNAYSSQLEMVLVGKDGKVMLVAGEEATQQESAMAEEALLGGARLEARLRGPVVVDEETDRQVLALMQKSFDLFADMTILEAELKLIAEREKERAVALKEKDKQRIMALKEKGARADWLGMEPVKWREIEDAEWAEWGDCKYEVTALGPLSMVEVRLPESAVRIIWLHGYDVC